jgi:hypothetical protein
MILVGLAQFAVRFVASCHALHGSLKTDSSLLKSRPSPTPVNLQAETQMNVHGAKKFPANGNKNAIEQVIQ